MKDTLGNWYLGLPLIISILIFLLIGVVIFGVWVYFKERFFWRKQLVLERDFWAKKVEEERLEFKRTFNEEREYFRRVNETILDRYSGIVQIDAEAKNNLAHEIRELRIKS